jgi:hypothetical protein
VPRTSPKKTCGRETANSFFTGIGVSIKLNILDKLKQQQLKALARTENWDALVSFTEDVIKRWQDENVIGATEFDTMKLLFMREGKIIGLREFFKYLDENSY